MGKITYKLKTVSPVFCCGANPNNVEIRPSSFKGLMRYWYRALIAENNLKELHRKENEIFGSTSNVSSFCIRIKGNKPNIGKEPLLAHKNRLYMDAIKDYSFNLELFTKSNRLNEIKDIFELSLLLGGIGKRSRRGSGSIANEGWEFKSENDLMEYLLKILNRYSSKNYVLNEKIISIKKRGIFSKTNHFNYPTIEEIRIGSVPESYDNLLCKIGKATHNHCNPALGDGKPRMASPVYVTIDEINNNKYYPVVTKLTPIYPGERKYSNHENVINSFIESVVR